MCNVIIIKQHQLKGFPKKIIKRFNNTQFCTAHGGGSTLTKRVYSHTWLLPNKILFASLQNIDYILCMLHIYHVPFYGPTAGAILYSCTCHGFNFGSIVHQKGGEYTPNHLAIMLNPVIIPHHLNI